MNNSAITFKKLMILFIIVSIFFSLNVTTYAFSDKLPDVADQSNEASVMLVSANSSYVDSKSNKLKIWFDTNNGQLTIFNGNFCASNNYDYVQRGDNTWDGISNRSNVTKFVAAGQVQYGIKYGSGRVGDLNCNVAKTFSFSNLPLQADIGKYYAEFSATSIGAGGVMNYYRLKATGVGAKIGQQGNNSGHGITLEQVDSDPKYINYRAPFGTPCSQTTEATGVLSLYDIDNSGGGGAQPPNVDVKVKILDKTDNVYVDFHGGTGKTWIPQGDNTTVSKNFTSKPEHVYVLEINDVYYNNTIQYSVPYDQIYSLKCPPRPEPKAPVFTPAVSGLTNFEKGAGDITAITHSVKVKPGCNTPNAAYPWSTSGDGDPDQSGNINVANNCGAEYTTTLSTASILASTLNSKEPGYKYNRSTTVNGISVESSGQVYEVPYTRFYGQDIYATGCGGTPAEISGKAFFNTKNTTNGDGGASQYATIAKSTISMATAALRTSNPGPPNGLSVPNYTGAISCSQEIYNSIISQLPNPINDNWGGGSINGLAAGYYKSNNNINVSGNISNSVTAMTNGNIYISDSITGGDMNKIATLIANGNVYIAPSVNQIDAILIAKGTVYTCANSSSEVPRRDWATQCNNKLTINGSVSAGNIRFARSIGTRLMAEDPAPTGNSINGVGGDIRSAAEIINFPAYLNFAPLQLDDTSDNSYQAIFNVPPLL